MCAYRMIYLMTINNESLFCARTSQPGESLTGFQVIAQLPGGVDKVA